MIWEFKSTSQQMSKSRNQLKQVLIINITRMGDLVQTGVLLDRLHHESPGVAIDLVVDRGFAPMASLLKGIRHVLAFDFQALMDDSRSRAKDVVQLHAELAAWARPLAAAGYDRVINLTFNRRSAWLVTYIGAPDVRGVGTTPDGSLTVKNPWLSYFTDLHRYRRFNRFNIVDLYTLGGSGPGPAASLSLRVEPESRDWAHAQLRAAESAAQRTPYDVREPDGELLPARRTPHVAPKYWIAVQIGASDAMKAWRPEYFGLAMAALQRKAPVGFVVIGTDGEAAAVRRALEVFRAASANAGRPAGPICDVVGRTDLSQLLGLLSECRLLLTNDTGPMHMAVSVGTPVVDLSVGHVDFRETGPYGAGHWVVQPDIECAPCGFDMVCPHHACKDRIQADALAALCVHALGEGPLPMGMAGVRLYESRMDEDGLASYVLRAGQEDPLVRWYSRFWRRYWYEEFTGQESRLPGHEEPAPDFVRITEGREVMTTLLDQLCARAEELATLIRRRPLPVGELKSAQQSLARETQLVVQAAHASPAFWPLVVALLRDIHSLDGAGLIDMARGQSAAYRRCRRRVEQAAGILTGADQQLPGSKTCVSA